MVCENCEQSHDGAYGSGLIEALQKEASIRQALLSVGLAAKGANYQRAKRLV